MPAGRASVNATTRTSIGDNAREKSMWELEDWKDLSKMLENFAEAALALVGIFLVLTWLAKYKD
jgi:hypothetical protein